MPSSPRQRLASLLLELYGDEWLLIPAMHYRWNHDNFLFGGRPSIGDFGLIGPLYAHLYRDPYPGTLLRREAPHV